MSTAREIMNPKPLYCDLDTPLADVIAKLAASDASGLLVIDEDQHLLGVITETDLVDQQASLHLPTAMAIFDMVVPLGEERFERELARMQAMTAGDLMSTDLQSVGPDSGLDEIAAIMSDERVHHLPVIDDDAVLGLITKHDVLKALAARHRMHS